MAFETSISGSGKHLTIILKDNSNGTSAEIFAFGALLNKFCAQQDNKEINVIEGFSSATEATTAHDPFFRSAKLSPYACRVKDGKYKFGEKQYNLKKHFSGPDAIHGVLFDAVFTVAEHSADTNRATVTLVHTYDNNDEGYPFRYKCSVEYTLTTVNALAIKTTVINADDKLLPVVDGWHPYFTFGDSINSCQLEFQSKEILEFNEYLIPTGKLLPYQEFGGLKNIETASFDNCFTLNFAECQPLCVLRNPEKKVQVEFYPSSGYPYLQIFTPDHRKSIAIENLSAAPDAFNNGAGLKVLTPGSIATFSTKFVIRFL